MKKGIYLLLVLVTCCWYSCSNSNTETPQGETTTSVQGQQPSTDAPTESTVPSAQESGASKITDAIVKQVCDCQKAAKKEDGTVDVAQVRSCMGASSTEFIANLLGPNSSEKQRADAQNELMERTANCASE